jgi:hypothetical protein
MADNENIFVEFDYQNIIVVDPNKIVDENGNAKERLINHEDLIMYANLECSLIPRTKLIFGIENNEQQTVSLAKINFLNPTNREFLNNNYTGIFDGSSTTDNSQTDGVITNEDEVVESSLLGITNINFKVNTSFMPTITMTLEDVRGKALFELGDKSPYAAFFNLPYPSFFLTLKGYYGKAVRYQLMLQNFNARFDNRSGNFVVDLTFLTYKFTVLSDVSMGYVLATPYMFKNVVTRKNNSGNPDVKNSDVTTQNVTLGKQKISELYNEYKSKGIISEDLPEYTVVQLQKKLDTFIKEVLTSWGQENMAPLTNLDNYSKTLNEFNRDFNTVYNSDFNTYVDKNNPYVLKDSGQRIYQLKPVYKDNLTQTQTAKSAFLTTIKKYNALLDSNPTCGVKGSYQISGKIYDDGEIKNRFKLNSDVLPEWLNVDVSLNNIDIAKTFELQYNKNYNDPKNVAEVTNFNRNIATLFGINDIENSITPPQPNQPQPTPQFYKIDGNNSFTSLYSDMSKDLTTKRNDILNKLSNALNDLLRNGSNSKAGLGFVPTIRNVLAVFFANGEAFLRLMDDVHREAWNKRNSDVRKNAILNSSAPNSDKPIISKNDDVVYPWPQFIVETEKNGVKSYDVTYPGDVNSLSITQGFLYDEWPEVEFVEELLSGFMNKDTDSSSFEPTETELTAVNRITFNSIEYPVSDQIYQNKEEVKYFYEIWERIGFTTNYSRLTRGNPDLYSVTDAIAESESLNIANSLGDSNVFLIKKLKEYDISPTNIRPILKSISNNGEGESYQKYIRGYYSTPYITQLSDYDFKIYDKQIFNTINGAGKNAVSIPRIQNIENYLAASTNNEYEFIDTYPFNNTSWVNNNLSNGNSITNINLANRTDRVIKYNSNINVISNFTVDDITPLIKRPVTYFNYLSTQTTPNLPNGNITTSQLKTFYQNRTNGNIKNQLPTEGVVNYANYDENLLSVQTTSMLNTPYFVNSIQKGVDNFRNFIDHPYTAAGFLFLNSLPLATLGETYKNYNSNQTQELDYLFATFKKFGAIHKIPYAWVLKYGSIWHRYKKKVENNIDILDDVWQNFNFLENYDPVNSAATTTYVFTGSGDTNETRIVLQANDLLGNFTASTLNLGFYPKVINDFSVFYNGYRTFVSGYTNQDIQTGINSGLTVFKTSTITAPFGFDANQTGRTLTFNSYSVTLTDTTDSNFFIIPSVGNDFNQTLNECFNNIDSTTSDPKLRKELFNNVSMYNGSVRTFWLSPNYGWFNNSKVNKPEFDQYLKKILTDTTEQNNFELNGNSSGYTYNDEILPTFKKEILDQFEQLFLNWCNSKYDFLPIDNIQFTGITNNNDVIYQNFQLLFTEMMKLPISKKTKNVNTLKVNQYDNFRSVMQAFMEYDLLFKYGNPSEYNKEIFLSFTNPTSASLGFDSVFDPYRPKSYFEYSPNALPSLSNPFPLSSVTTNYPQAWKTLNTHVGFSKVNGIGYTNSGSTIFDFFIDNDIEFNEENIKNLSPLIKIYATQKSKNQSYGKYSFESDMLSYVNKNNNFQNLVLQSTMSKVRSKLSDVNITPQQGFSSELIGAQGKVELWESLKATNDRWIAGYDMKYKTIFEDVLIMDRASRDLGDKVLVDVIQLNNILTNINVKGNLLYYVQSILQMNNFQVMSLPSFVNFYNVQDPIKNAIPKIENSLQFANDMFGTYPQVDYRNSGPKMVCFYAGKPSEHLSQTNQKYNDDGIDFNKLDTNTLTDNLVNKTNWSQSNRVVGFTVDMGIQNQNVFDNISVSQDVGKPTSESLKILNDTANQAGGRKTSTQNLSLYNLYKTRSYGCTVSMLGCAMIQPMMYFNLRHVPMFSGSYMILNVNHSITPGGFTTQFGGVRQSIYSLPNPDTYLQSMLTSLLNNVFDFAKQEKAKQDQKSQNTAQDKQNQQIDNNNTQINLSDSCTVNSQFEKFEKITNPTVTKKSFNEMIKIITGITSNIKVKDKPITNVIKDKLNYTLWSFMYLNWSSEVGFEAYENNFVSLALNLKINNSEIKLPPGLVGAYVSKKYFCLTSNNLTTSMATFLNATYAVQYAAEYFANKIGNNLLSGNTIKINNQITNIDEVSSEIYKFLYTQYPTDKITIDQFNKVKNNQATKDSVKKIKEGIGLAQTLGL